MHSLKSFRAALATFGLALACAAPLIALPARAQEAGRPIVIGRSYEAPSLILGQSRRVNVYLPQHYGDPARRFPVLFLLDGGEDEDFHHISGLAQVTAANGRGQELIVVGIESTHRQHDLTSPTQDPGDIKVAPTEGGAAAYRRFLVEEVKPWVAAHYRTNGHTALIGESLAGLFAAETFLRAPQSFDDYIIASPSLWWDRQSLSREAEADLRKGDFSGRRLWLSIADEGTTMQAGVDRLVAALKAVDPKGLVWTYDPRPQERHDTIYHPTALAAFRRFYALPKP